MAVSSSRTSSLSLMSRISDRAVASCLSRSLCSGTAPSTFARVAAQHARGDDRRAPQALQEGLQLGQAAGLVHAEARLALLHAQPRAHPQLALHAVREEGGVTAARVRLHEEDVRVATALLRLEHQHAVGLDVARQVVEVGARPEAVVGVVGAHLLVAGGDDQRLAREELGQLPGAGPRRPRRSSSSGCGLPLCGFHPCIMKSSSAFGGVESWLAGFAFDSDSGVMRGCCSGTCSCSVTATAWALDGVFFAMGVTLQQPIAPLQARCTGSDVQCPPHVLLSLEVPVLR